MTHKKESGFSLWVYRLDHRREAPFKDLEIVLGCLGIALVFE